jgi:hypothetical protein
MNTSDMSWVPPACNLHLIFNASTGEWEGSLRLRCDYLGYLVERRTAATSEEAAAIVRTMYETRRDDQGLDVALAGYYRVARHEITSPS